MVRVGRDFDAVIAVLKQVVVSEHFALIAGQAQGHLVPVGGHRADDATARFGWERQRSTSHDSSTPGRALGGAGTDRRRGRRRRSGPGGARARAWKTWPRSIRQPSGAAAGSSGRRRARVRDIFIATSTRCEGAEGAVVEQAEHAQLDDRMGNRVVEALHDHRAVSVRAAASAPARLRWRCARTAPRSSNRLAGLDGGEVPGRMKRVWPAGCRQTTSTSGSATRSA